MFRFRSESCRRCGCATPRVSERGIPQSTQADHAENEEKRSSAQARNFGETELCVAYSPFLGGPKTTRVDLASDRFEPLSQTAVRRC